MKILFLSADKFPPFRVDVAVLFGMKLTARGYVIDWLLQSEADCAYPCIKKWAGGKAWVAATDNRSLRRHRLKKHFLKIFNELKVFSLARRNGYQIIQVKDDFLSALPAVIAAKRNRCKFVYWLSYPFPEANIHEAKTGVARYPLLYLFRGHFFKFLLYRIILPAADHVFVQSEQMKKDIASKGIGTAKISPVPMGVDIEKIPYLPSDFSKSTEKSNRVKTVLYLGTLNKVRRMDFLIRAFALVLDQHPRAKLFLIGGGEDPSDELIIKEEMRRLGVSEAVIMTGFLPMRDAWEYVRNADVCVSPFYPTFILNSTSPTKLVEYMAMGKAVVANDHPEQRLVIEESGGGICVPYQEKIFADAIAYLLTHPEKACEMGKKGRAYVERFRSYDVIAGQVDREYQMLCNGGKHKALFPDIQ